MSKNIHCSTCINDGSDYKDETSTCGLCLDIGGNGNMSRWEPKKRSKAKKPTGKLIKFRTRKGKLNVKSRSSRS